MAFLHTISLALIGVMATIGTANAGPEKIKFPEGFEKGVRYAVIDRHDNKQYRELYANEAAVKAIRAGQPLPYGTVLTMVINQAQVDDKGVPRLDANGRFMKGNLVGITVMEKQKGWGAEYPDTWRNGEWEYSSFTPDRKFNEKANLQGCFQCHKPHEKQDFVISHSQLNGTFPTAAVAPRTGAGLINILGFKFGPEKAVTVAGTPVTWTNTDDSPHQIEIKGKGKTGVLLKGQSASLTVVDPGSYEYICSLHPAMKGTLDVTK
jgi:plastocyanin